MCEMPILNYKEELIHKAARPFDNVDAKESTSDTERDESKFECNVDVHSRKHRFIEIGTRKTIQRIHYERGTHLRKGDQIIAINDESVEGLPAGQVHSILQSCLKSGNDMTFTMTILRTSEESHMNEIGIRFAVLMTRETREHHGSETPKKYTRNITLTEDQNQQKDIIMKMNILGGQPQYVFVENDQLKFDVVDESISINQCIFTLRKYKVCTRSMDDGKEEPKIGCTLWFEDKFLKGCEDGTLVLEEAESYSIPEDQLKYALFYKRTDSNKGSVFESMLYMWIYVWSTAKVIYGREKLRKKEKPDYYIHCHQGTQEVSLSPKRPKQNLGETRRKPPDECRFEITSPRAFVSLPVDEHQGSQTQPVASSNFQNLVNLFRQCCGTRT